MVLHLLLAPGLLLVSRTVAAEGAPLPAKTEAPRWARELAARVPATDRPSWKHEMKGLDPKIVGWGHKGGMGPFMDNRWKVLERRLGHWRHLARKLMPNPAARLRPRATLHQARQLFDAMRDADIGTHIPDDRCADRALIAAAAGQRAGFTMYTVHYAAGPRSMLRVKTPNVIGGEQRWGWHEVPAVRVGDTLMIIDPSMFDRPVSVPTWTAAMHDPDARLTIKQAGIPKVNDFAFALGMVEGVRRGYEPLRAHALVDAASR
jgi:hypothetical protein